MSQVIRIQTNQDHPSEEAIRTVSEVLAHEGVGVVPTDSVYGLVCVATKDNPAHRRIFEIKERPLQQTLPLFIADPQDLEIYGQALPAWALHLANHFWPGALTLVVRASSALAPEYVQQETGTIALRVPASELVRSIVRQTGPLAQTSANTHGVPAATSGEEIEQSICACADIVVDGGPSPLACASTIVDCTHDSACVLREGALSKAQIEAALI